MNGRCSFGPGNAGLGQNGKIPLKPPGFLHQKSWKPLQKSLPVPGRQQCRPIQTDPFAQHNFISRMGSGQTAAVFLFCRPIACSHSHGKEGPPGDSGLSPHNLYGELLTFFLRLRHQCPELRFLHGLRQKQGKHHSHRTGSSCRQIVGTFLYQRRHGHKRFHPPELPLLSGKPKAARRFPPCRHIGFLHTGEKDLPLRQLYSGAVPPYPRAPYGLGLPCSDLSEHSPL